jgi:hypothetical protein
VRNIWIIWRKELRSYFSSPVAYLLLAIFAFIFGFFFWNILGYFVNIGMESQMRGEMYPMNLNEQVIRPLLANVGVIGLFFIPMITMRLFAEEKRSGTIELLVTSPIRDGENNPGQVAVRINPLRRSSATHGAEFCFPLQVRQSGLEAAGDRLPWPASPGGGSPGDRNVHFHINEEPNYCWRCHVRSLSLALGPRMGRWVRDGQLGKSPVVHFRDDPQRLLCQGRAGLEGRHLLRIANFCRHFFHSAFPGIAAVEVVSER